MAIIETNYEKAQKIIWEQLGQLADEKVPDIFAGTPDEEMDMAKEDRKIALAYQEGDTVLGRIAGKIEYGYMFLKIEAFAVEKEARGKGVGHQLLKAIEDMAISEGCTTAFVETVSFSAPDFYKKQGYSVLCTLEDYPVPGITNFWFYKRLYA